VAGNARFYVEFDRAVPQNRGDPDASITASQDGPHIRSSTAIRVKHNSVERADMSGALGYGISLLVRSDLLVTAGRRTLMHVEYTQL
jgi:hypothetical protein